MFHQRSLLPDYDHVSVRSRQAVVLYRGSGNAPPPVFSTGSHLRLAGVVVIQLDLGIAHLRQEVFDELSEQYPDGMVVICRTEEELEALAKVCPFLALISPISTAGWKLGPAGLAHGGDIYYQQLATLADRVLAERNPRLAWFRHLAEMSCR